jgi:hypothetical protein
MNYKLHYCSRAKTEPVLLTIIQDTKIKPPDFLNANFILIFLQHKVLLVSAIISYNL